MIYYTEKECRGRVYSPRGYEADYWHRSPDKAESSEANTCPCRLQNADFQLPVGKIDCVADTLHPKVAFNSVGKAGSENAVRDTEMRVQRWGGCFRLQGQVLEHCSLEREGGVWLGVGLAMGGSTTGWRREHQSTTTCRMKLRPASMTRLNSA